MIGSRCQFVRMITTGRHMEGMGSLTRLETDVEEVAVVKTVKEE
jgi:hypothetical protein